MYVIYYCLYSDKFDCVCVIDTVYPSAFNAMFFTEQCWMVPGTVNPED